METKLNIYQVEQEYLNLTAQIIESGGEVTPEQEEALAINQANLEQKSRGYGYVIKQLDSDISVIDAEIDRLKKLKESRNKTIDRLKETVLKAMELYEIDKIETPTLKISIRNSESVEVTVETDLLNEEYVTTKVTKTPNKTAIKEALKEGKQVFGAELKQNKNLQLK